MKSELTSELQFLKVALFTILTFVASTPALASESPVGKTAVRPSVVTPLQGIEGRARARVFIGLGQNVYLDRDNSGGGYDMHAPLALQLGLGFKNFDLYLEHASSSQLQGNSTVAIERQQSELSAWGRRVLRRDWKFAPYLAAGLGVQRSRVVTSFMGETRRQSGRAEPTVGLAGGFQASIWRGLETGLESRLTAAESHMPTPRLAFALRLGWRY